MVTWEYKTISIFCEDEDQLTDRLNTEGRDGWEVYQVERRDVYYEIRLKRKVYND